MKIQFNASLPPIQSALKIGADGIRAQIDIPETDKIEGLKLAMLTNKAFKVTVEVEE